MLDTTFDPLINNHSTYHQYKPPSMNLCQCQKLATYNCTHCPTSCCLQHGLEHQDELKEDIRRLLAIAQVIFISI